MSVPESFGSMVFDDRVMKSRLPGDVYRAMKQTIKKGKPLDTQTAGGEARCIGFPSVADAVAAAMRDWAVSKGATHFTHWFQPMTGITAEKHDSFISPAPDGGVIMEFSGKELIKGEPDASSFPSGGLRATFEARGYTAWDPTSYAFVKGKTLCIPTAFCSYGGEALDKKTPLLRSMEALNRQSLRILKLFGNTEVSRVMSTVGPEQEYFLIDKELYKQRRDLVYTGRTLFGAKPPKGQELDDHYFGAIKPRVAAFMDDLNNELWSLGILAKTEHNEVAPSQHELAPIHTTANIATDHNQLTMEIMQKVAERHGLVCLLHEKPFAGVNGSGKHNNWSLSTDTGMNLLSPGDTPWENAQFLLFLVAVIRAVDKYQDLLRMSVAALGERNILEDEYQDLLRISVASAGNDHRLGANEAPPAVISMFLGDELTGILEAIEEERPYSAADKAVMKLGVHTLPRFARDTTDRNRTSPFAFTGNKFEFRMLGSSNSIACANIMLNAAVADSLSVFADRLEKAEDFDSELHDLIKECFSAHKRIIFNGNGYNDEWIKEATEKRGLLNLRTTPDCVYAILEPKNVQMLISQGVFSMAELRSRYEITLENYCKTVTIEANTMIEMVRREILPAIEAYVGSVAETAAKKKSAVPDLECRSEKKVITKLSVLSDLIDKNAEALEASMAKLLTESDTSVSAFAVRDDILPKMAQLRAVADEAETLTAKSYWPFPGYGELLFSV